MVLGFVDENIDVEHPEQWCSLLRKTMNATYRQTEMELTLMS
jgi:hypothetical protein